MQLFAAQPCFHPVYMSFMLNQGWSCQFLEADLKTPLPPKLTFSSADKVREFRRRFYLDSQGKENLMRVLLSAPP